MVRLRNEMLCLLVMWCVCMITSKVYGQHLSSLKAYYTRLSSTSDDFVGKYADIVVDIDCKGSIAFDSNCGYLPYWNPIEGESKSFPEVITRRNLDGLDQFDKWNTTSQVSIVEQNERYVVVHWRYISDLSTESIRNFRAAYNKSGNPSSFYAEFTDEYYIVYKNAHLTRIIKQGCYLADEWDDPNNAWIQEFRLTSKGLKLLSEKLPVVQLSYSKKINAASVIDYKSEKLLFRFNFDEAVIDGRMHVREKQTGKEYAIEGVRAHWYKGVSGSCLLFDSYSNAITIQQLLKPHLVKNGFSVSCWFATQEYPFNTAALIDNLKDNQGFFLGMNRMGELVFILGNGETRTVIQTDQIPLYTWTNVVASYDVSTSMMYIYLNGVQVCSKMVDKGFSLSTTPICIGMTKSVRQYPYGAERNITRGFMSNMVFSGLIDEFYVFKGSLSDNEITNLYNLFKPKDLTALDAYILPANTDRKRFFGATYSKLPFYGPWDDLWRVGKYADLEVTFDDKPWRYVFWRGTRYLPSLVTDYGRKGVWSNDQGPEVFLGSCYEHMSDMLCRYSRIRLIANTPARVIVHWRNASVDIQYQWPSMDDLGRGIWTDEYWCIYPDGTSIRHQQTYNAKQTPVIEMNQNEILHHPGQMMENVIMDEAVIVGNEKGELQRWRRSTSAPDCDLLGNKNLLYINLNSPTKLFQIGEIGTRIDLHLNDDVWWNGWNHYPCQLIPSDGTVKLLNDRSASACVSTFREYRRKLGDHVTEAMQIYGLTTAKPEDLLDLNRSWNFAPKTVARKGCTDLKYIKNEKAYYLVGTDDVVEFDILADKLSPIVNPALIISKFCGNLEGVTLYVNGVEHSCKKGVEWETDGTAKLVLWFEHHATDNIRIRIDMPHNKRIN